MYNSKKDLRDRLTEEISVFCNDYYKEFRKQYDKDGSRKEDEIEKMKFAIDKLVSIYELKYPDHIIGILMQDITPSPSKSGFNIWDIVNSQLERNFGEEQANIDWMNIININDILPSLTVSQREFLKNTYSYEIKLDSVGEELQLYFRLKLNDNGTIKSLKVSGYEFDGLKSKVEKIISEASGKSLRVVLNELYNMGIPRLEEFERIACYLEKWEMYRKRFLELVMKKIFLIGGNRMGPKRAFLFALEYNLDISFPIMYGLDSSDPHKRYFINEYLKEGGNQNLLCYIDFMSGLNTYKIALKDRLKFTDTNGKIRYTKEEKKLHNRLVRVLSRKTEMPTR